MLRQRRSVAAKPLAIAAAREIFAREIFVTWLASARRRCNQGKEKT
jgi:hypothetical protein